MCSICTVRKELVNAIAAHEAGGRVESNRTSCAYAKEGFAFFSSISKYAWFQVPASGLGL